MSNEITQMYRGDAIDVSYLLHKTIKKIVNNHDELLFFLESGEVLKMFHRQDCCESVTLEDINGELIDLIGSPILLAEMVTNNDLPSDQDPMFINSCTWTFYKLATISGYVTLRWYGESNGYYSESVDFERVDVRY